MADFSKRLERLENRINNRPDKCDGCGASWPGSVFIELSDDGTQRPACLACGHDRRMPAGAVKAYGRDLMDFANGERQWA